MKFWITVTVGIIVVTGLSTALFILNDESQQVAQPAPVVVDDSSSNISGKLPKAVVTSSQEVKIENIPQDEAGQTEFTIRNDGDVPLQLKTGTKNCGCMEELKLTKERLNPGEETKFITIWNTGKKIGEVRGVATVETNDPLNKVLKFSLVFDIKPDLLASANDLNFGYIKEGSRHEKNLYFFSTLHDNLSISEVKTSNPSIQVKSEPMTAEELKKAEAKSGVKLVVSVEGTMPVGQFFENINIKSNVTRATEKYIGVAGTVHGSFTVQPSHLDFGVLRAESKDKQQEVTIFARGLKDSDKLAVGKVEPAFLSAEIKRHPKLDVVWQLFVSVKSDAPAGQFTGSVSIMDGRGTKKLNLPVKGVISGGVVKTVAR